MSDSVAPHASTVRDPSRARQAAREAARAQRVRRRSCGVPRLRGCVSQQAGGGERGPGRGGAVGAGRGLGPEELGLAGDVAAEGAAVVGEELRHGVVGGRAPAVVDGVAVQVGVFDHHVVARPQHRRQHLPPAAPKHRPPLLSPSRAPKQRKPRAHIARRRVTRRGGREERAGPSRVARRTTCSSSVTLSLPWSASRMAKSGPGVAARAAARRLAAVDDADGAVSTSTRGSSKSWPPIGLASAQGIAAWPSQSSHLGIYVRIIDVNSQDMISGAVTTIHRSKQVRKVKRRASKSCSQLKNDRRLQFVDDLLIVPVKAPKSESMLFTTFDIGRADHISDVDFSVRTPRHVVFVLQLASYFVLYYLRKDR